jgi:hypothetical protein
MTAFLSSGFMFVAGMLPFRIRALGWTNRVSSVAAGKRDAVPARPGAAAVPLIPPTPWQVWQENCVNTLPPETASALGGVAGAAGAGELLLGAAGTGVADVADDVWVPDSDDGVDGAAPRVDKYATSCFISAGLAVAGGIPPAFIFAFGLCSTLSNAAPVYLADTPTSVGAMRVPPPLAPWQAAQPWEA